MEQPSTPQYPQIQPSQVVTGADATNQAMQLANQYFAPQMNAQAQGIADINQGQGYYNNFGPSTLAEATGNQYFNNIWPQEQSMIQNQYANSGMNFSPALASTEANAFGNLSANVGQYEQGISNQNATNNLSDLLSINPNNYYQPISNTITGQSNEQANLNQQANMQNANATYSNSLANYNQQLATNGAIGSGVGAVAGGIGGAFVGNPIGSAMVGSSLGGAVFGGSQSPASLGNSLMAYNYFGNQAGMMPSGSGSYGTQSQLNTGAYGSNPGVSSYSNNASSGYGSVGNQGTTIQSPYGQ